MRWSRSRANWLIISFLALGLVGLTTDVPAADSSAPPKIKVLIVTGFDVGAHNWRETAPQTRARTSTYATGSTARQSTRWAWA